MSATLDRLINYKSAKRSNVVCMYNALFKLCFFVHSTSRHWCTHCRYV